MNCRYRGIYAVNTKMGKEGFIDLLHHAHDNVTTGPIVDVLHVTDFDGEGKMFDLFVLTPDEWKRLHQWAIFDSVTEIDDAYDRGWVAGYRFRAGAFGRLLVWIKNKLTKKRAVL